MAALAEGKKKDKYANLNSAHTFTRVAIETSGVFGPQSTVFDVGGLELWFRT